MADHVSGTIKIIAEVVGGASSPIAGSGSLTEGKERKDAEIQKKGILDTSISMGKILKLVGIGGILSQSKIMSGTLSSIVRIFGAFLDMVLLPLAPLLIRGLTMLGKVVSFVAAFMKNPGQALSDAWNGFLNYITSTWNKKGFFGLLGDATASISGSILIGTIFAATITPKFVARKLFGLATWLVTNKAIKVALGLVKRIIPNVILDKISMLKNLFVKGAMFTKSVVRAAFGLGVSVAPKAIGWIARIFPKGVIVSGIMGIIAALGIGTISLAAVGAALVALAIPVAAIGATVAFVLLLDWILKKTTNKGLFDWVEDSFRGMFRDWELGGFGGSMYGTGGVSAGGGTSNRGQGG